MNMNNMSELQKTEGVVVKTLFLEAVEVSTKRSLPTKIRSAEVKITETVSRQLKKNEAHKKGMFQNEISYRDINPELDVNQRLDLCCFYNGRFHFIEYKHYDKYRKGDSNLAILRGCINDILKLWRLSKSKSKFFEPLMQRYTFCCFIFDDKDLQRIDTYENDISVSKRAIKKWFSNPNENNTTNSLGRIKNIINAIESFVDYLNSNRKYKFAASLYNDENNYFLVANINECKKMG